MKKHLFIINPAAGKRLNTGKLTAGIKEVMRRRGEEYIIRITESPGHATELVRQYVAGGGDWRVYACGGDGTLNEVVCGAAGSDNCAISQIACGTGNDFLRFFDGGGAAFRDIEAVVDGEEREFDLMEANGHFAINICSVGFDARVAATVHRFSKLPGVTPVCAFTVSALYNFLRSFCNDYRIKIEGPGVSRTLEGQCALICVASARYYGGGYMPMGDTDPTDGVLDLLVIGKASRLRAASLLMAYKAGKYEEISRKYDIKVLRLPVTRVEIDLCGRSGVINADGEIIPAKKALIRLSQRRIRFFAPSRCLESLNRLCEKRYKNANAAAF